MTSTELGTEYTLAAQGWQAYCERLQSPINAETPIVVLLLSALAEPPNFGERFTGDLVADLLGILQSTVSRWQGRENEIEPWELRLMQRRLELVIELRRRAGGAL